MNKLFTARTTDGSSDGSYGAPDFNRARMIVAWGTWDGATLTMEVSVDDTTWVALEDGAFTVDTAKTMLLPASVQLRATVASAGGSTSLNCWVA